MDKILIYFYHNDNEWQRFYLNFAHQILYAKYVTLYVDIKEITTDI